MCHLFLQTQIRATSANKEQHVQSLYVTHLKIDSRSSVIIYLIMQHFIISKSAHEISAGSGLAYSPAWEKHSEHSHTFHREAGTWLAWPHRGFKGTSRFHRFSCNLMYYW